MDILTAGSLLKHLEFWHAGYNQVDLLAKVDERVFGRLKGKVNLLKVPQRISFFSLLFTYFYLIFKSKNYDLVIEIWENRPSFSLILNTRRSLVAIFSRDFKCILPRKVMGFIYRKAKFLVNSGSVREKLIIAGFKPDFIKFIADGVVNNKASKLDNSSIKKKNKILIICGKDIGSAVSLISLIERKSLDWKFVVQTDKKYVKKLKKMYELSGLTSGMKVIPLSIPVFDSNLTNSKFLLVTKDVKKVFEYISYAFMKYTPVILEGDMRDVAEKRIRDLILNYDNKMDIASKIFSFSKNTSEYLKLQRNISKSSKSYTWEEVGELSLKYIESL